MPIEKKGAALLALSVPKTSPKKNTAASKPKTKKPKSSTAKSATLSPDEMVFGRLVGTEVQPLSSEWCWAVCAVMVARSVGIDPPTLESLVFGVHNSATAKPGVEGLGGPGIEDVYESGKLGVPINCKYLERTISQFRIDQALSDPDRPSVIELGLAWHTGGMHVVLVTGFSPSSTSDETFYYVNDPDPYFRRRTVTYDGLVTAFSKGDWIETFAAFGI